MGDDVQEALALLREFMRNKKLTPRLRKDCAIELLDRAIGRPTQHNMSDVNLKAQFDIVEWAKEREQRRQAITGIEDSDSGDPNDEG